jgi:hypothetical protein
MYCEMSSNSTHWFSCLDVSMELETRWEFRKEVIKPILLLHILLAILIVACLQCHDRYTFQIGTTRQYDHAMY